MFQVTFQFQYLQFSNIEKNLSSAPTILNLNFFVLFQSGVEEEDDDGVSRYYFFTNTLV